MSGRRYAATAIVAAGLLTPGVLGCSPPDAGTIDAPALDRSQGPTLNPNNPGVESVIPAEDRKPAKKRR